MSWRDHPEPSAAQTSKLIAEGALLVSAIETDGMRAWARKLIESGVSPLERRGMLTHPGIVWDRDPELARLERARRSFSAMDLVTMRDDAMALEILLSGLDQRDQPQSSLGLAAWAQGAIAWKAVKCLRAMSQSHQRLWIKLGADPDGDRLSGAGAPAAWADPALAEAVRDFLKAHGVWSLSKDARVVGSDEQLEEMMWVIREAPEEGWLASEAIREGMPGWDPKSEVGQQGWDQRKDRLWSWRERLMESLIRADDRNAHGASPSEMNRRWALLGKAIVGALGDRAPLALMAIAEQVQMGARRRERNKPLGMEFKGLRKAEIVMESLMLDLAAQGWRIEMELWEMAIGNAQARAQREGESLEAPLRAAMERQGLESEAQEPLLDRSGPKRI